jgi:hypothetical protein
LARDVDRGQTFFSELRLKDLKGTHKPLIHPPLGSCREAGAFFSVRLPRLCAHFPNSRP